MREGIDYFLSLFNHSLIKTINSAQILVENIALQVDELTEEIDRIVSCHGFSLGTAHLSLESLYEKCLVVYEKNEELKEELETKLEQYSYQRKDQTKQKANIQPIKANTTTKSQPVSKSVQPTQSSQPTQPPQPPQSTQPTTHATLSKIPKPNFAPHSKPATLPSSLPIKETKQTDTTIETSGPSPPHTPPRGQSPTATLFDDFPRTPTLEDFGISASTLELIAKDQTKKQKKISLATETSKPTERLPSPPRKKSEEEEPRQEKTEKRTSSSSDASTSSSRSSLDDVASDMGNVQTERRKPKSKRHRDKAPATLFPLMEEIRQDEYTSITPEYLKHSFTLEQLNKAVQKINDHMTDRRFSMDEEVSEGAMESFTEADLRDDMEFGVKAKGLVLLLIHLKRIALDKRFGGTRLTILENTTTSK